MSTCTDADYGRISLAVLQKDKPVPAGRRCKRLSTHALAEYYRDYSWPGSSIPRSGSASGGSSGGGMLLVLLLGLVLPLIHLPHETAVRGSGARPAGAR